MTCPLFNKQNAFFLLQDAEDALLQGEKEAEKMIVEAYSALLLAFLSTERSVFLICVMLVC